MPIPKYAVLVGRAVDRRFATVKSNHYEIKISAAGQSYRIAVNVQSADGSEVLYAMRDPFAHPMLAQLGALADGHHPLASAAGGLAIDFVRTEHLQPSDFVALPATNPGDDNDLNDRVDGFVARAISQKAPAADARHPPVVGPRPVAPPTPPIVTPAVAASMRIVAALANSLADPEIETVTLLNASPAKVDLAGWVLADKNKNKLPLSGAIDAGAAMRITVAAPMQLSNKGGAITLIDG